MYGLACLAGSHTGGGSQYHFIYNQFGFLGMLFQVVSEGFAHGLVDGAAYFAVAQLGLGLSLELGLRHFDGDNGDESFAEVFARYFYFGFFELLGAGFFTVLLQYTGQRSTESGFVCSAFLARLKKNPQI